MNYIELLHLFLLICNYYILFHSNRSGKSRLIFYDDGNYDELFPLALLFTICILVSNNIEYTLILFYISGFIFLFHFLEYIYSYYE